MKVIKKIKKINDKTYSNYFIEVEINLKRYRVPFIVQSYGKAWTDPSVRRNFTILDLICVFEKDDEKPTK